MDASIATPGAGPVGRVAAPLRLLVLAVVAVAAVIGGAISFSVSQPWLGLGLGWDAGAGGMVVRSAAGPASDVPVGVVMTRVRAGGDELTFERLDLTGQVDGVFGPFADFQRFMSRQGRFASMQRQPEITFTDTSGRDWTLRPAPSRPVTTLGADFWIGAVVGAVSGLVAAAIFVFRPREAAARYVLLSGFGMLICAPIGPIYTSRELGLPELSFYLINGLNFLGGSLFAAALFSLLLYYPRQLAPRWVGVAVVGAVLAWYAAQALGWFPDLTFARRFHVMCALAGTFVLAGIHWRKTRRDPLARAALSWFLLSWVVVAAAFCLTILAPQMFDVDTSAAEPFGFLLFILIYAGLAVGIMRYRLFELGEWWVRIVAWTLGLVLLVALDLLFLAGLRFSAEVSLSLALLICGLIWLPARGWIAERILRRRPRDERALFEGVVQIGLTASPEEQAARWAAVLKSRFDPLSLEPAAPVEAPRLEADGLALVTPAMEGLPSLRLAYAHGGRSLFSPADIAQTQGLADMLRFVVESRRAYERGVIVERQRIAGDIHDNLGATLLSALHSRDGERKDRYIRETLADLRSIVTEPAGDDAGLAETLAGSRKEMAERLGARGIELDWPPEATPRAELDSKVAQSLRAMLREITNNILKHAGASVVRVALSVAEGRLTVTVEDDGVGFDPASVARGAGLGGLSDRAARHGGEVRWASGLGGRGARAEIRLPTAG
ncbi:ATP-binding protein [Phenylobacterium sp.]|uniref:sensor histidine kinase n=1 Tax=Phenylobacterium sp. TaxID=1871053 RepID=UPI00301D009D